MCFFSTILKVESTTAGCHVALFQFFLSFKICCTRTDTCFQQTFTGSFNVLGFIPPFSTTELSWYTPRSRGLEGRVDVYRVATHIMVCLCKFVSVYIWNNGQLLFFQICIRVFFTLNILKACFFFVFWSSVGFGANCVDLSDLIFIFNFCATLTPSRDDVKVQKQSIDPRTPTITFAAHQTLFRFLSNYLWFTLEVPPIFLIQTEVFSVLKELGLFASVMPNCRGSIRVYMGITACHSGCVQITLTDRRASSSIISLELCLVALHPLPSFLSETQFCPEMTSETVVFFPPPLILIIHCAVMTSGD